MNTRCYFLFFFYLISFSIEAQEKDFQEGYYLFPIRPEEQNYLAGKMGEIRPNHFHGGLDIKTGGVSGYDVYAAADGYVERVKVSTRGYGSVVYLKHPNGQKTVYAHLSRFEDKLANYVQEQQYQQQQFEVELFPDPKQFQYKRGELIALSGNSGSSAAPHLHFEVRTANDEPLKTLRFGFDEIKDTVPPWIRRFAINPLDMFSRTSGGINRQEYKVIGKGGSYKVYEKIPAHGRIGLELYAFDKANAVHNVYGIYRLEVWVNGKKTFQHQIDRFSFYNTRQIHRFINYDHYAKRRQSFQRCYIVDGNQLPFYEDSPTNGWLNILDGREYEIEIRCYDVYENLSTLSLTVIGDKHAQPPSWNSLLGDNQRVIDNTYYYYQEASEDSISLVVIEGFPFHNPPAYKIGAYNVYLWNLLKGIPSQLIVGGDTLPVDLERMIPSNVTYFYNSPQTDIYFGKNSLYDTLYLSVKSSGNAIEIGDPNIPMPKSIEVTFRPQGVVFDKQHSRIYEMNGRRPYYIGGDWDGEAIRFATRSLGKFELITDTEPPTLGTLELSKDRLRFRIQDKLSGIESFDVWVNGEWVLMCYDYRKNLIWSCPRERQLPFSGSVKIRVVDKVGNEVINTWELP